jgi:anti-sigma28 factor (negative regulator of flagellin synthesis)
MRSIDSEVEVEVPESCKKIVEGDKTRPAGISFRAILAARRALADDGDPTRTARIEMIRIKIDRDTYEIYPDRVAGALVDESVEGWLS